MPKKPLHIFIGERHNDFSSVSLVDQLLKSCEAKGLKVAFYPEDDSQLKKIERFTDDKTGICGAENLPENWREVAVRVDAARDPKVHLVGNRAETVFDPFYEPIAGVDSNNGKFSGAKKAFSEVVRRIEDPTTEGFIGVNPAFLPAIQGRLEVMNKARSIDDPANFGYYVQNVDNILLLSSAIANRMVNEINRHQADVDVKIVLIGFLHSENVATRLGISKNEMIMIANCENDLAKQGYLDGVNVMQFDLEEATKAPYIPSSIEERLSVLQQSKITEQIHEKTLRDLDTELGIGDQAEAAGSKEIRQSWASKVSKNSANQPERDV